MTSKLTGQACSVHSENFKGTLQIIHLTMLEEGLPLLGRQHKSIGCPIKQGTNSDHVCNCSDLKLLKSALSKYHSPETLTIHSHHHETST